MAVKSNITILNVDPLGIVKVKVGSATVLAEGDLINFNGTAAVVQEGNNPTFLGVAMEGSESGQTHQISVATHCIISALLVSGGTAGVLGDAYKRNAGSNGVDWSVDKATAEGIMWVYENNIAVGEKGLFLVNSHHLVGGILFDVMTT